MGAPVRQHPAGRFKKQIHSLCRHQSGNDRKHRNIRSVRQGKLRPESALVFLLAFRRAPVVTRKKVGVLPRIIINIVNAVQNSGQLPAAEPKHAVHPVSEGRRADLLGITGADGRHRVGGHHGALHKVEGPVQVHKVVRRGGQGENIPQNAEIILSLIFDVVNGKDRADLLIPRLSPEKEIQIDRHQRRLMVMRVQNVREKADLRQSREGRHREKGKPFPVVIFPVQTAALKIIFIINKIIGHFSAPERKHAAILLPPGKTHRKDRLGLHFFAIFRRNLPVKRHHHPHIQVSPRGQRRGERAQHIAQSPRGGKRHDLRAHHQNFFHTPSFKSSNPCRYKTAWPRVRRARVRSGWSHFCR